MIWTDCVRFTVNAFSFGFETSSWKNNCAFPFPLKLNVMYSRLKSLKVKALCEVPAEMQMNYVFDRLYRLPLFYHKQLQLS